MAETKDYILSTGVGFGTYMGTKLLAAPFSFSYLNKIRNYCSNKENQILKQAAKDCFEVSGLKEKGVSLIHVDPKNVESIKTTYFSKVDSHFDKNSITYKILDKLFFKKKRKKFDTIANGKNASFFNRSKKIFINLDKLPFASFHEMGHAINANNKGFANILSKIRRPMAALVPAILLIGLCKKRKQDSQKPESFWDKTTTFVKNNAGKLAFTALIPKVLEEGMASINGAKLAKKALSPEMLKKVNRLNLFAWSTYVISAALTGIGISLGIKVKDKIMEKRQAQMQK